MWFLDFPRSLKIIILSIAKILKKDKKILYGLKDTLQKLKY